MLAMNCPHCNHHLQIPEQYAGQQGKCMRCGQPIVAPVVVPEGASAAQSNDPYGLSDLMNLNIDLDLAPRRPPAPAKAQGSVFSNFFGDKGAVYLLWGLWLGSIVLQFYLGFKATATGDFEDPAAAAAMLPTVGIIMLLQGMLTVLLILDAYQREVGGARLVLWGLLGFLFQIIVIPIYLLSIRADDSVEGSVGRAMAGTALGCVVWFIAAGVAGFLVAAFL